MRAQVLLEAAWTCKRFVATIMSAWKFWRHVSQQEQLNVGDALFSRGFEAGFFFGPAAFFEIPPTTRSVVSEGIGGDSGVVVSWSGDIAVCKLSSTSSLARLDTKNGAEAVLRLGGRRGSTVASCESFRGRGSTVASCESFTLPGIIGVD